MNERCCDDILGERGKKRGYYSRELLKTNIILKNDGEGGGKKMLKP